MDASWLSHHALELYFYTSPGAVCAAHAAVPALCALPKATSSLFSLAHEIAHFLQGVVLSPPVVLSHLLENVSGFLFLFPIYAFHLNPSSMLRSQSSCHFWREGPLLFLSHSFWSSCLAHFTAFSWPPCYTLYCHGPDAIFLASYWSASL